MWLLCEANPCPYLLDFVPLNLLLDVALPLTSAASLFPTTTGSFPSEIQRSNPIPIF